MSTYHARDINDLVKRCHSDSLSAGWWHDTDPWNIYVVPMKLMLIVSEVAEAMEGHRKDLQDDKLPNRKMAEVELADAIIRICDLAGWLGYDLGGAVVEKLEFNKKREDHKLEARAEKHGKAY